MEINLEYVLKKYGCYIVVNDVFIILLFGWIYGLIGFNGSGKLMILKMMVGFFFLILGFVKVDEKLVMREMVC